MSQKMNKFKTSNYAGVMGLQQSTSIADLASFDQMSRKSHSYRRLSENEPGNRPGGGTGIGDLIRIPFRDLITGTVALPFFAFIFNIFYVLHEDFDRATNTHCDGRTVKRMLPSFSSAVGTFPLAKTIWAIAIALHAATRFLVVSMTFRYLESVIYKKCLFWAQVTFGLGIIENFGLICLTYVSSKQNFPVHMWCFISFISCSEFYMLIYCILLSRYRNIPANSRQAYGLQLKWNLFFVNVTFAILSALAYGRHVNYCEEGVYTYFALFKYIVVFTNMFFHGTAYFDFFERVLVI